MTITPHTSLGDFVQLLQASPQPQASLHELLAKLHDYPLAEAYNRSYNELSFGQLAQLQDMHSTHDLLFVPLAVVHHTPYQEALLLPAFDCLRLLLHTTDELDRITKLFAAIAYTPTPDEQRAGIARTAAGFFGTADWYARRMGITDHDLVFATNWMRIYKCLAIDHANHHFERQYRQQLGGF